LAGLASDEQRIFRDVIGERYRQMCWQKPLQKAHGSANAPLSLLFESIDFVVK
jgi:hypothetical protein